MQGTQKKDIEADVAGVNNSQAAVELERLIERHFGGDAAKAALALGRETDDIKSMIGGDTLIDDDLLLKARGIEQERSRENDRSEASSSDKA